MINRDRLGYYQIGLRKFYSKISAVTEHCKTGYEIEWIFNDSVYEKFDWTKTIEIPLSELYRLRAQQIRDTYDYICLFYSGGGDSNNVLHSFIDNGIFLDEIIMFQAKPDVKNLKKNDTSNRNGFAEIEFEAKSHLQTYKNLIHRDTKIREFDIVEPFNNFLKKDDWFLNIAPSTTRSDSSTLARRLAIFDNLKSITENYEGKKIAQILGCDKPLVWQNNDEYYFYFLDSNTHSNMSLNTLDSQFLNNDCRTELFYWSPDLPELVIKQAQLVKAAAETNLKIKNALRFIKDKPIGNYRKILHPIIYPPHTEPNFQVAKINSDKKIIETDRWFWDLSNDKIKYNYTNALNFIKKDISTNYLTTTGEISAFRSKFYKL